MCTALLLQLTWTLTSYNTFQIAVPCMHHRKQQQRVIDNCYVNHILFISNVNQQVIPELLHLAKKHSEAFLHFWPLGTKGTSLHSERWLDCENRNGAAAGSHPSRKQVHVAGFGWLNSRYEPKCVQPARIRTAGLIITAELARQRTVDAAVLLDPMTPLSIPH